MLANERAAKAAQSSARSVPPEGRDSKGSSFWDGVRGKCTRHRLLSSRVRASEAYLLSPTLSPTAGGQVKKRQQRSTPTLPGTLPPQSHSSITHHWDESILMAPLQGPDMAAAESFEERMDNIVAHAERTPPESRGSTSPIPPSERTKVVVVGLGMVRVSLPRLFL